MVAGGPYCAARYFGGEAALTPTTLKTLLENIEVQSSMLKIVTSNTKYCKVLNALTLVLINAVRLVESLTVREHKRQRQMLSVFNC